MRRNPPANRLMLAMAVALAAFFVWGHSYVPGRGRAACGDIAGIRDGVLLAGLIIWIVLGRIQRLQRTQRRALREREPQARAFGSYALNGVAAYLSRAIPLLALGPAPAAC